MCMPTASLSVSVSVSVSVQLVCLHFDFLLPSCFFPTPIPILLLLVDSTFRSLQL
ncbi:hypothetical protein CPB83DRAFT_851109, partial [Crepidotus variabilis]